MKMRPRWAKISITISIGLISSLMIFTWVDPQLKPSIFAEKISKTPADRQQPNCSISNNHEIFFNLAFTETLGESEQSVDSVVRLTMLYKEKKQITIELQEVGSNNILVTGNLSADCTISNWHILAEESNLSLLWTLHHVLTFHPSSSSEKLVWRRMEPGYGGRFITTYFDHNHDDLIYIKEKSSFFVNPSYANTFVAGDSLQSHTTVTIAEDPLWWIAQAHTDERVIISDQNGELVTHQISMDLKQIDQKSAYDQVKRLTSHELKKQQKSAAKTSSPQLPLSLEHLMQSIQEHSSYEVVTKLISYLTAHPDEWTNLRDHLTNNHYTSRQTAAVVQALVRMDTQKTRAILADGLAGVISQPFQDAATLGIAAEEAVHPSLQRDLLKTCQRSMTDTNWRDGLSPACLGLGHWAVNKTIDPHTAEEALVYIKQQIGRTTNPNRLIVLLSSASMFRDREALEIVAEHVNAANTLVRREALTSLAYWHPQPEEIVTQNLLEEKDPAIRSYLLHQFAGSKMDPNRLQADQLSQVWNAASSSNDRIALIQWLGAFSKEQSKVSTFLSEKATSENNALVLHELGRFLSIDQL